MFHETHTIAISRNRVSAKVFSKEEGVQHPRAGEGSKHPGKRKVSQTEFAIPLATRGGGRQRGQSERS